MNGQSLDSALPSSTIDAGMLPKSMKWIQMHEQ